MPVFFADQQQEIPAEVQIRPIAIGFQTRPVNRMKNKQNVKNQEEMMHLPGSYTERIAVPDE